MAKLSLALRILLPTLWLGMLLAISFLEAPLKFLAPGITIPLGLGIGRLVFLALGIAGAILLIGTTLSSLRPRVGRVQGWLLGAIWVVFVIEQAVIRPPLNARTDAVLAGVDDGGSVWHYLYIAADVVLVALLVAFVAVTVRRLFAALPASLLQSGPAPAPSE